MDVSAFLDIEPAPRVLFQQLAGRADQPRFFLPLRGGGWRPVTWGEFGQQVRRTALDLRASGLQAGDRAAIFAANRVEWLSAALAIQAVAGVMVPIYPSCTADQAAYVLQHADCAEVFVDGPVLMERVLCGAAWPMLRRVILLSELDSLAVAAAARTRGLAVPSDAEIGAKVVAWAAVQARGEAEDLRDVGAFDAMLAALDVDQPGLMLYTSGTSGQPKGVPLTHRNVGSNGRDWLICNAPLLSENMTDFLWLPMSHIFGFGEACLGNTLGFASYLCDPASVLPRLAEVRPSVFMSVPSLWEKLAVAAQQAGDTAAQKARLDALTGGRLQFCLSGGAGLKVEIKEFLCSHGLLVMEGYGLTECSPTLTLNRPTDYRFDSVGKPLPSVELRLDDDGEILARGPGVFAGYHKDPEATAAVFTADGWLRTGDVGRWTEDGFLQIIDRKKDILVTSGGKNVPPANIELQFRDDPDIAHVVVYGDARSYLVAGVWLNDVAAHHDGLSERVAARVAAVNAVLARHEAIKKWRIMDRPLTVEGGLLTPTLKIKRKFVYEAFRQEFEELYA
jgi:long-chain acyl-CoA synthetase